MRPLFQRHVTRVEYTCQHGSPCLACQRAAEGPSWRGLLSYVISIALLSAVADLEWHLPTAGSVIGAILMVLLWIIVAVLVGATRGRKG